MSEAGAQSSICGWAASDGVDPWTVAWIHGCVEKHRRLLLSYPTPSCRCRRPEPTTTALGPIREAAVWILVQFRLCLRVNIFRKSCEVAAAHLALFGSFVLACFSSA